MQLKKNQYLLFLLIYINFVNIIFCGLRVWEIATPRAIIVYDYFFIVLLVAFRAPAIITWGFFSIVFILDLLTEISFVFLFNLPELVKNIKFSFFYSFSWQQCLYSTVIILFLILNYLIIKKISNSHTLSSRGLVTFFCILLLTTFVLDFLNGDSVINKSGEKIVKITKFNIGESMIKNTGVLALNLTAQAQKPQRIPNSITFDSFAHDNTNSQLLIIVESWGLPQNEVAWSKLKELISTKCSNSKWDVSLGSTPFKGSTTAAELRELIKCKGDYRYLLNREDATTIESIFYLKKEHGYHTVAAHSFSSNMFLRSLWWKNIGVDSTIFMESVIQNKHIAESDLNYSTPFTSLYDENVMGYLDEMVNPNDRNFGYILTENTHLPFYGEVINKGNYLKFEGTLSKQASNQIARIQELLFFYIENIDKNKWQKILIVGDHMPPFAKESDRNFYSNKYVPYMILSSDNLVDE